MLLSIDDETIFPQTRVQTCIVHLLRNGMNFTSSKEHPQIHANPLVMCRDHATHPTEGKNRSKR